MSAPEEAGRVETPSGLSHQTDSRLKRRRSDLPDPPTVSNLALAGLVDLGGSAWSLTNVTEAPFDSFPQLNETPEQRIERERRDERQKAEREEAKVERSRRSLELREEFRTALNAALADAYDQGADAAVAKAERTAWNARSVALYLLVFAVVLMPAIAMVSGISPQDFGSYVAPITGIAGTVVGYWFSRSGA